MGGGVSRGRSGRERSRVVSPTPAARARAPHTRRRTPPRRRARAGAPSRASLAPTKRPGEELGGARQREAINTSDEPCLIPRARVVASSRRRGSRAPLGVSRLDARRAPPRSPASTPPGPARGSGDTLARRPDRAPRPRFPSKSSIAVGSSHRSHPGAIVRPTTRELTFSDGFRFLMMVCCRIPFGSGFVAPRAKSIDRDGRGLSGMVGSVGLGETAGRPGWDLTLRARYFLGIAVSSAICLKEKSEPKCQRVLSGMSAAHANSLREKRVPPHREIFRCVFAMTAGKLSDD